ncbi:MAG TPA: replicative DNA helicase [Patescibacteria group bacterium]
MAKNLGRIPPQNVEAEQSVLGALLIDKDAIISIAEILKAEHFYKDSHAEIFRSCLILFEKREPIDLITLTNELKKNGTLEKVGGSAYLAQLASFVPTAANITHYAKIVKDDATKRELISAASKISELSFDESNEVKDLLDQTEQAVFSISQSNLAQNFIPIRDTLAESFDRIDELHKNSGSLRGIATGFRDLDNKLAGMQDSNLLILASRPGVGKTTLALNIAMHSAVYEKVPCGIFSLEMSKEELVDRLLVAQADVDAWRLKTGNLDDLDFDRLQEAMGELADAPLYIDDTPGINILEMRTKARRLQIEKGLRFLVVDYLQLIHGRNLENRVQEVSEISQSLKNLARELKIPVLACAQLSRAVESRGTKQPVLADLRESGAIEQDADVVMFLYREDSEAHEQVKLSISKHRNGPLGDVDLLFRGDRVRFYGIEKQRAPSPIKPQVSEEEVPVSKAS